MRSKKSMMTARAYSELAAAINSHPDPEKKKILADELATIFRKRYPSFDPYMWERATGGKVQGYDIQAGKFVEG